MSTPVSLDGLTLVIPCYNEAARLDGATLLAYAEAHPALRLLLVDDGSTDGTAAVLESLHAQRPASFEVLRLRRNGGKAEAVRLGIRAALRGSARYVGFWDADLAAPLEAVAAFYQLLEERPWVELTMGARVQLLGREIVRRGRRHYLGRAFATAVSLVLDLPVYDTQCGAKVFRVTDTLPELFREPFRTRWIFDVELLARLIRSRRASGGVARIVYELPLDLWRDVGGSKLRAHDFLRAAVDLARIWWWLRSAPAPAPAPPAPADLDVPVGGVRA